ncbi:PucR family transcriptional regulator [Jatrophihabitans cynanchi]|uniref:PucR family transcriptional regulator n=1 Tax=Jatrophihabitans cynanchi TaxID=2944128 RepID=A0ABY7K4S1_9ACTN|nr:PucR family transcriptional regulator [Jatrophihabitans sp. SB3-54]WAX58980.1 PucR family transcriptional regulator [Jatrophihabitans sp. SB3-54]
MAITLAALVRSLQADLVPYPAGRDVPATPITAVHMSELPDPRQYLEGGELLLTTGLSAVPTVAWFRAFFARLQEAEIAGLALGLGPRFADVPPGFAKAAAAVELPLFIVPVQTPFLTISRRYWQMSAVPGRRQIADALAGHRALIEAATEPNAESAVIRRLAAGVGGWAAHLSPEGALLSVQPAAARSHARQLRDEVARLAVAGVHAAATLPVDDQVVVLHPLADRAGRTGHVAGYIAVGSTETLHPEQRHLVLAGVAVLGAQLNHRRQLAVARSSARAPVLQLLLGDQREAARALAGLVAPAVLDGTHRPAVLTGTDLAFLTEALAADNRCELAWDDGRTLRVLLAGDATSQWLGELVHARPTVSAAIGTAVGWDYLAAAYELLAARAGRAEPGTVAELGVSDGSLLAHLEPAVLTAWARRCLEPILQYERADLVPALVAYLRHSGGWEPAARELGVHRHTLRHRVRRAEELLGVDLDSVDVTAELWLALRALVRA